MSNDARDIEWRCGCGHTNPDFAYYCTECLEVRFPEEEAEAATPVLTHEQAIAELHRIGDDVRALRDRMPADSPNQMVAFQLAALIGEIEARLNAEAATPAKPEGATK